MKRSKLICILTDVHLWVPVVMLILGTTLLMTLR
ncbi:MAG: translocated intimin receptor Tir [Terracidiphilus sp.]